jgi:hypothetical protein
MLSAESTRLTQKKSTGAIFICPNKFVDNKNKIDNR